MSRFMRCLLERRKDHVSNKIIIHVAFLHKQIYLTKSSKNETTQVSSFFLKNLVKQFT